MSEKNLPLKRLLLMLCMACMYLPLKAQQEGLYSQYMMNYFLVNPAVAGINDALEVKTGYRKQWAGIAGAPRNYYASGHMPLNKAKDERINRRKIHTAYHAAGAIFSGQTLGALTHNTAYLTYAYHLPLTVDYTLSMGAMAGINQYSVDQSALHFADGVTDPAAGNVNNIKPDLGLGMWLYSDHLFVGLSALQVLQNKIDFSEISNVGGNGLLNRHFILTGGYNIEVTEDLKIVPSVLMRKTLTAFQVDLNTKVRYKDLLWAGASYRREDASVIMGGFSIPLRAAPKGSNNHERGDADVGRLEIGYAYDLIMSHLNSYSRGSHEIMVGLVLPVELKIKNKGRFW